jgi:hypothetical protein
MLAAGLRRSDKYRHAFRILPEALNPNLPFRPSIDAKVQRDNAGHVLL